MGLQLMEKMPAEAFADAYLLGNGELGASVYGGIACERILLNADTLWSGQETTVKKPQFYEKFLSARNLALADEFEKANQVINEEMEGVWGQAYLPMAEVCFTMGQRDNRRNMKLRKQLMKGPESVQGYERTLRLREALAQVKYQEEGTSFFREMFVSHPARAAAVRLRTDKTMDFAISLDSRLKFSIAVEENRDLVLKGIAPDHAEPSYTSVKPSLVYHEEEKSNALRFAVVIRVCSTDGEIDTDGTRIYVRDAGYADILIAGDTNYCGYGKEREKEHGPLIHLLKRRLDHAGKQGYELLRKEHIEDVSSLFDAAGLNLGEEITGKLPTSERLKLNASSVDDPSVCALALQYGRYLTIAGSRKGSQPMNLQGIWNPMTDAPWACNYTTNINVQMNYWSCETLGLPECHEPLLEMIRELAESGERTAQEWYHCGGWTAHHNVDLWRLSVPSCEDAAWSWWPMAGAWLCQHLYTHYQYSQEKEYLKSIYPVIRGCARFLLDFLVEGEEGELLTAPSISPENKHVVRGKDIITAVTKGSTMDITLIREVLGNLLQAAEILSMEEPLEGEIQETLERLPPYKTGRYGQLQEWYHDEEECFPGMGHMSHLYGLYPGEVISRDKDAAVFEAAGKSLLRRRAHGGLKGGWPGAWAICLGARLGYSWLCAETVRTISARLGANLLDRDCFQIDCILGWTAGIAEMLLQSHEGVIRLLPALPAGWREGFFHGFRARGNFRVDLEWKDGRPMSGKIYSGQNRECCIEQKDLTAVLDVQGEQMGGAKKGRICFRAKSGEEYRLIFESDS